MERLLDCLVDFRWKPTGKALSGEPQIGPHPFHPLGNCWKTRCVFHTLPRVSPIESLSSAGFERVGGDRIAEMIPEILLELVSQAGFEPPDILIAHQPLDLPVVDKPARLDCDICNS